MCKRKNVVFEITQLYNNDNVSISSKEKKEISTSLNTLADMAKEDHVKGLYRLKEMVIPNIPRRESTLYAYKVTDSYRVILSYDDDMVYDRKIISLYRIVPRKETIPAFNSIATMIYGES